LRRAVQRQAFSTVGALVKAALVFDVFAAVGSADGVAVAGPEVAFAEVFAAGVFERFVHVDGAGLVELRVKHTLVFDFLVLELRLLLAEAVVEGAFLTGGPLLTLLSAAALLGLVLLEFHAVFYGAVLLEVLEVVVLVLDLVEAFLDICQRVLDKVAERDELVFHLVDFRLVFHGGIAQFALDDVFAEVLEFLLESARLLLLLVEFVP